MDRFEKAEFDLAFWKYKDLKPTMECLSKGTKVVVGDHYESAVEDFPDLEIALK